MTYQRYIDFTNKVKTLKSKNKTLPVKIGEELEVILNIINSKPIRGKLEGIYVREGSSDIIFLKKENNIYESLTGRLNINNSIFRIADALDINYK